MPLWLSLMLLGWLVSLLLALRFGSLMGWKRGYLIFLVSFAIFCWLITFSAEKQPQSQSRSQPVSASFDKGAVRIWVVDLERLILAHSLASQWNASRTNRALEAHCERTRIAERKDQEALDRFDRELRSKYAEEQKALIKSITREVRNLIEQKAAVWQIDVVLNHSTNQTLILESPGWTNLTEAILRELKP